MIFAMHQYAVSQRLARIGYSIGVLFNTRKRATQAGEEVLVTGLCLTRLYRPYRGLPWPTVGLGIAWIQTKNTPERTTMRPFRGISERKLDSILFT